MTLERFALWVMVCCGSMTLAGISMCIFAGGVRAWWDVHRLLVRVTRAGSLWKLIYAREAMREREGARDD